MRRNEMQEDTIQRNSGVFLQVGWKYMHHLGSLSVGKESFLSLKETLE